MKIKSFGKFNVQNISNKYLEIDVNGLYMVIEKYNNRVLTEHGVEIINKLTIAQLG